MLLQTQGILLKTNAYGNTSLICQVLTVEHGMLSIMLKGIRSPKQRNQLAVLQPTAVISFVCNQKPGRQIHPVSSFQSDFSFLHILNSPHKISILFIMQEILWKIHRYHPLEQSEFDYHLESLQQLSFQFSQHYLLNWLVGLIQAIQLEPEFEVGKPGQWFHLSEAEWKPYETGASYKQMQSWMGVRKGNDIEHAGERRELIELLIAYLQAQISEFGTLKSVDIIRSIYQKQP